MHKEKWLKGFDPTGLNPTRNDKSMPITPSGKGMIYHST